ncbi:hypothetical protein CY34DRAFT_801328 [Suillus luteus UH-Slu-Lm8-n1]|uniref:Glucose receptor Git3 N-terminal domain-containing protein n=1 Tax=Suillus luteus UH-Slu-Lm8-n1 TaxID=930992 RepID=A0A0D0BRM9_9AGAM|nr:hypothetical protein CY34DRAFT_801328 [Suillus luteus UH-Slu-Lm8-n1]
MTATLHCSRCWIIFVVWNSTGVVVFAMLWVIISARLHAMYQRSRWILIFLIVAFLADSIFNGIATVIKTIQASGEEYILSGTYQCAIQMDNIPFWNYLPWILGTVWEVLALCLAAWIAIKHFRELRQHSSGGLVGDCFTVLMKTHMLYFASFVIVSCLQLIFTVSPTLSSDQSPLATLVYYGVLQISLAVQAYVLGPRLILGVREYHAKLVAGSDTATDMTSIAFQGRVHVSTGSDV